MKFKNLLESYQTVRDKHSFNPSVLKRVYFYWTIRVSRGYSLFPHIEFMDQLLRDKIDEY
jgi:hypothetical protein